MEIKEATTAQELFKGYPHVFHEFLDYANKLEYEERPDYAQWITKFEECQTRSAKYCWAAYGHIRH